MSGAKKRFSSGIGSKNRLSWEKEKRLFFPGNASKWKLIREEEWLAMAYVVFGRFLSSDLLGSWTINYNIPPAWAGVTPKPS